MLFAQVAAKFFFCWPTAAGAGTQDDTFHGSSSLFFCFLFFRFCPRVSPFFPFSVFLLSTSLFFFFSPSFLFSLLFGLQQEEREYKEAQKALRRQSRERRRRSDFRRKWVGEVMKEHEAEAEADLKASQEDGMKDAAAYREVRTE